jgi:hypothetical protein
VISEDKADSEQCDTTAGLQNIPEMTVSKNKLTNAPSHPRIYQSNRPCTHFHIPQQSQTDPACDLPMHTQSRRIARCIIIILEDEHTGELPNQKSALAQPNNALHSHQTNTLNTAKEAETYPPGTSTVTSSESSR